MRLIFFALAALTLAAAAALWSDGADVASGGPRRAPVATADAAPPHESGVVRNAAPSPSEASVNSAGRADGSLDSDGTDPVSTPERLAAVSESIEPPGPGSASEDAADVESFETLQLAEPAPFPEEAAASAPDDVAMQPGEHVRAESRESAPFDPDWSAALVRRLLALHRTLAE